MFFPNNVAKFKFQFFFRNLNKLPRLNQVLIKKFLCVLYHIARLSDTNKMTSQNLAICIAPSLVWSTKAIVPSCPKETTAACEFVQFMIENYVEIFGEEATRILGDESEIQPPVTYDDEDLPDQNSDAVDNDSVFKSPEVTRAKKADFTLSLRVPDLSITPDLSPTSPEIERKSNTTPRIPNGSRFYDLKMKNRRHSENDLTDLNDNLPTRKLRAKVPLTSYTATAELIKHNINGEDDLNDPSSTVIRIVSSAKETSPVTNGRRKNSPSNHAIYHRKVRPTPTYEEAIRQLRRNAQFSPLFSRKSEGALESSDDSIDQKLDDRPQDISRQSRSRRLSSDKEESISPSLDRSPKTVKLERQKFTYNIGSPVTDRLKSSNYAADDFRRKSPEQVFAHSGNSRHPSSPAYEQHLQRRKRFEAAYLQKINLDLNDFSNKKERLMKHSEYNKGIDFTHSYNGNECEKTPRTSGKSLATSLDSAGLRSLRLRSGSGGQNSVPLSNGIHTFITQRRNQTITEDTENKPHRTEHSSSHATVTSTVSANPRLTPYGGERDNKPPSPLRAAIDVGSFMYRPSEREYLPTADSLHENGHRNTGRHVNGIHSPKAERNNNDENSAPTLDRKQNDRNVEDFDKLFSSLKSRADSNSTISSDSVGTVDVPSHEDIKTILCQDESYV